MTLRAASELLIDGVLAVEYSWEPSPICGFFFRRNCSFHLVISLIERMVEEHTYFSGIFKGYTIVMRYDDLLLITIFAMATQK